MTMGETVSRTERHTCTNICHLHTLSCR